MTKMVIEIEVHNVDASRVDPHEIADTIVDEYDENPLRPNETITLISAEWVEE